MCKYCEKGERLDTEFSSLRVEIIGSTLEIGYDAYSTDSSFSTEIDINYCMMCGEKLNKTEQP
jgi:hypothetical protein